MLDKEALYALSQARLAHARDCMKEAEILLGADEYKGAANRAYYAAFHSLRAVLILEGFDSKKHSGIIAKFREMYVKEGLFTKEISDAIASLFRVRSASDYDDFYILSKQEAISQLENAKLILTAISDYLNNEV